MSNTKSGTILCLGAALTLGLAACGGDDDGSGTPDSAPIDAPEIDAEVNTCTVLEASYPDLGPQTGTAFIIPQEEDEPDGIKYLQIQIPLNTEAMPDVLHVELWEDAAPFLPTLSTGTFPLLDDQTDAFNCGTCVFIAADVDGTPILDFHMANGGTLTVDTLDQTIGTGQVTGTLTDVKLRKVELGSGGQTVPAGGCKTEVTAASFDFVVDVMSPPSARVQSRRAELRRTRSQHQAR